MQVWEDETCQTLSVGGSVSDGYSIENRNLLIFPMFYMWHFQREIKKKSSVFVLPNFRMYGDVTS